MQARFLSVSVFVLAMAAAAPALAQGYVGSANGGVWKTTNGGAATEEASPDQVQTAPSATVPIFLELDGIPGESSETPRSPPPPPPPPQNAPAAEHGVQSQGGETTALLVPAIQRVRDAAARAETPAQDVAAQPQRVMPELPICGHCSADVTQPQNQAALTDGLMIIRALATPEPDPEAQAQTDGLLIMRAAEGEAVVPEQPVCGYCGTDVAAQPEAAQPAPAPAERPRRGFSLSIGGITVGSGGVSVAAGDVTGDSQGAGRQHRPVRTTPPSEQRSSSRRR